MEKRNNYKYKPVDTNTNIQPGWSNGNGIADSSEENHPGSGPSDKKWCIIWRCINVIMVIFFLLAALANINDVDWFLWVPVYFIPAVFSFSIVINPSIPDNKIWRIICVVFIAANIAHAIYLSAILVEVLSGKIENPIQHEEGREMAGTLIIIIWLALCTFTSLGRSKPGQGAMNMLLLMTGVFGTLPLFLWGLCFVSDWHTKIGHCKDMFRS